MKAPSGWSILKTREKRAKMIHFVHYESRPVRSWTGRNQSLKNALGLVYVLGGRNTLLLLQKYNVHNNERSHYHWRLVYDMLRCNCDVLSQG